MLNSCGSTARWLNSLDAPGKSPHLTSPASHTPVKHLENLPPDKWTLQVCHHYLVPLLATIPLDSSLLKRPEPVQAGPPETLQEKVAGENGEGGSGGERDAQEGGAQDDGNGEPPAIVIYIVDPFR